jgi:hypothetical protein
MPTRGESLFNSLVTFCETKYMTTKRELAMNTVGECYSVLNVFANIQENAHINMCPETFIL